MNLHKNEVHLAGELARDPDTRYTQNGKQVTTLSVLTKHKTFSEYHRVICWEQLAEKATPLTKGEFVKVVGRLQTRSWDDKRSGQKRYTTETIAWQLSVPGKDEVIANVHGVGVTDEDIPF